MLKKYPAPRKPMREEYSMVQYSLRAKVDDSLHSDVAAFWAKNDTSLDNFVNQLLKNKFASERVSDPHYPV